MKIQLAIRLPLEGSETATAVLNDSPVGCQTRGVTEPQRDRWRGEAATKEGARQAGAFSLTP
jgi:hypothetical protein